MVSQHVGIDTLMSLPSLYGLVLGGGGSRRMKRDKSALHYHGKPQLEHAFDLLTPHCEQVFVSIRKEQEAEYARFPQIHDTPTFPGPLSGILSAMIRFPDAAWCVLANDLPYVDTHAIQMLIQHRTPDKVAVAFRNPQKSFPEPLCTIYEPAMQAHLMAFMESGGFVFRKALEGVDIQLLEAPHELTLFNVNYPEEYQDVLENLAGIHT
jgi:molybdopterin-guanine dinucleotide biosynthesis protein A